MKGTKEHTTKRFAWVLYILLCIGCSAERGFPQDTLAVRGRYFEYPFINTDTNRILDSAGTMQRFYKAMDDLESGRRRKVTIVHIGDSHIQADFLSGTVRRGMQGKFGSAGRGLVFPYSVARTNTPDDIRSSSNVMWEAKRNVFPDQPLPIGISGITIRTENSNFLLNMNIQPNDSLSYAFNKVTVFSDPDPGNKCYDLRLSALRNGMPQPQVQENVSNGYHTVHSGETLSGIAKKYGVTVSQIKGWNGLRSDMIRTGQKLVVKQVTRTVVPVQESAFRDLARISFTEEAGDFAQSALLDTHMLSLCIRGERTAETQQNITLYGLLLENTQAKGILYNTIGVNGAKFDHYNKSRYFFDQLAYLEPDLIIISLGTNEASALDFNESVFRQQVEAFMQNIRSKVPSASVLFTTPPEINLRRKTPNPRAGKAGNVLKDFSQRSPAACWDLHAVMGGNGSMVQWQKKGLGNYDGIHFTRYGYTLQGELLLDAILNGLDHYRKSAGR